MTYRITMFLCAILAFSPIASSAQLSADFDNNGTVDFVDFLNFAAAFGSTQAQYDLDSNGHVDFPDFLIFVSQFQQANTQTGAPTTETVLKTLDPNHPRLFLKNDRLADLKTRWETDTALKKIVSDALSRANGYLNKDPLKYELVGTTPRLLSVSREALERICHLSLAWRWTGQTQYLDKARETLLTVCGFQDWHPPHFLDVAEMTNAVGLGYDWLYNDLDPTTRQTIRNAIVEKGLKPGIDAYNGLGPSHWWPSSDFNWNQVCNGGLIVGALAIADEDSFHAKQILLDAYKSLPIALKSYDPDGAWGEGPGYWDYATRYTAYGLSALQTALGTTFGLANDQGLANAGYFPVYAAGPTDYFFNYADVGEKAKRTPTACNFWLASTYDDDFIAAEEHQILKTQKATAQHVMWYVPDPDLQLAPDGARMFRGLVDVAFMRSAWNDPDAVFVGVKAGYNQVNHGHLDLGNFVMDALGVRWAMDLGSDSYDLPGYFDEASGQRWTYYRLISESHNVPLLNFKGQDPKGTSSMTRFQAGDTPFAVVDLSNAYERISGKITRGVKLVNNQQDVLVQDDYDLDTPAFVGWGMTTEAAIALQDDGSAILSLNGKQLHAILLSPKGWKFGMGSAEQAPPQATNKGISRLTISPVYEIQPTNFFQMAVLLSPVRGGDVHLPEVKPISEW